MPSTIKKLLIANRGEIAVRIIRTCKKLGITTVVAFTLPDVESVAVKQADFSVCIGDHTQYLSIETLLNVAKDTECDAVHPGKFRSYLLRTFRGTHHYQALDFLQRMQVDYTVVQLTQARIFKALYRSRTHLCGSYS